MPILIADDSEDDLLLLDRAMHGVGIRNPHLIARTGEEAINYLAQSLEDPAQPFPVVLFLDLLMPKVSGIAVLEWLRDHAHPPLPVVLHTGVEDDLMLQQARDLGASYYLPKGTRPEAILEVFRRTRAEWEQYQYLLH